MTGHPMFGSVRAFLYKWLPVLLLWGVPPVPLCAETSLREKKGRPRGKHGRRSVETGG